MLPLWLCALAALPRAAEAMSLATPRPGAPPGEAARFQEQSLLLAAERGVLSHETVGRACGALPQLERIHEAEAHVMICVCSLLAAKETDIFLARWKRFLWIPLDARRGETRHYAPSNFERTPPPRARDSRKDTSRAGARRAPESQLRARRGRLAGLGLRAPAAAQALRAQEGPEGGGRGRARPRQGLRRRVRAVARAGGLRGGGRPGEGPVRRARAGRGHPGRGRRRKGPRDALLAPGGVRGRLPRPVPSTRGSSTRSITPNTLCPETRYCRYYTTNTISLCRTDIN